MRLANTILIVIAVIYSTSGQTLHYNVIKGNKKLGDMTVVRSFEEDLVMYTIRSQVTFRLLFAFTVDFEAHAKYKEGLVLREYTKNELNGRTQKEADLRRLKSGYEYISDDVSVHIEGTISYSIAAIYYKEPEDDQQVFSPAFGRYLTFKKIGYATYSMESPDGINIYEYENGICTRVQVNRDFAKFSFKMTPGTLLAVQNRDITQSDH